MDYIASIVNLLSIYKILIIRYYDIKIIVTNNKVINILLCYRVLFLLKYLIHIAHIYIYAHYYTCNIKRRDSVSYFYKNYRL